jgi:hypothetical protein
MGAVPYRLVPFNRVPYRVVECSLNDTAKRLGLAYKFLASPNLTQIIAKVSPQFQIRFALNPFGNGLC